MKVAFVYDRVNKFGGAERVLMALHTIWPDAPLFTSVYDPDGAPWAKDWDVRVSWLQNIPGAKNNHESFGWLMPLAFESLDFSGFDVVISVTSEAAKGVITNSRQLHVCYLLTPTRYLWSHHREYLDMVPRIARPLAVSIQSKLRLWDFMAAQRPDYMIAISEHVRKRCQKFYRRGAEVMYPPVMVDRNGPTTLGPRFLDAACPERIEDGELSRTSRRAWNDMKRYFLVVSRLVPYKRVDLAIAACNELKAPLVIVGTGSDEKKLKRLARLHQSHSATARQAGPTVQFVGHLTDSELVGYYRGAKALLMPQEEDFGLVGVEAQAYGVPVISYRYSGIAETIKNGKTGILFEEQSVVSVVNAIQKLEVYETSSKWEFRKQDAERFSLDKFKQGFRSTIEKLWKTRQ